MQIAAWNTCSAQITKTHTCAHPQSILPVRLIAPLHTWKHTNPCSYFLTHEQRSAGTSWCATGDAVQTFSSDSPIADEKRKKIPVLCDVRVKLIRKIKAELSQSCNHCSAWWVVSVSRRRSGRIWLQCRASDSNRGRTFSVRGQVAAGNGRGKVERKEDSGWVWVVQLIMFPPSSSPWPWNQNRG